MLSTALAWPPGSAPAAGQAKELLPHATASLSSSTGTVWWRRRSGLRRRTPRRLRPCPAGAAGPRPGLGPGFHTPDLATKLAQLPKADCLLLPLEDVAAVAQADPQATVAAGWLGALGTLVRRAQPVSVHAERTQPATQPGWPARGLRARPLPAGGDVGELRSVRACERGWVSAAIRAPELLSRLRLSAEARLRSG